MGPPFVPSASLREFCTQLLSWFWWETSEVSSAVESSYPWILSWLFLASVSLDSKWARRPLLVWLTVNRRHHNRIVEWKSPSPSTGLNSFGMRDLCKVRTVPNWSGQNLVQIQSQRRCQQRLRPGYRKPYYNITQVETAPVFPMNRMSSQHATDIFFT